MGKRWHAFRNPWNREYAMRGVLWRGREDAAFLLPHRSPGTLVVDLGCGDGKFLAALPGSAVGLDFAPHALRLARSRLEAPLVLGDVRALPFKDERVPCITARYILGALLAGDRDRLRRELERVLAPGGLLAVEEFGREDFRYGHGVEVEPATFERNRGLSTHYFAREELASFFPTWDLVEAVERRGRQRLREGVGVRVRWRLLWRKPQVGKSVRRAGA